jgi:tetratricopeptide (TPR) repeat protein
MEAQLQIRHIGYQDDKPRFVVVRGSDMKWGSETALTPPDQTIVPGRPNNNLQQDLRWYLEQFLELPLGAYLDTAERVQATLQEWGSACFDSLFQKQARDWFQDVRRQGLENLTLKIASNDPRVLAWPWEALHDREGGTLAHHCRIERQLSELHDPLPLPVNLPKDRINILLVIARPYGDKDVGFHALSRPLVDLTKAQNSPVHIDVLRPPTFDQLRQTLRDKPGFYHIVHFDGHGGYGTPGHTSPHAFKGMQGMLVFEDDHAEPANVDAGVLSQLMAEHRIPIMVLNACQSAKIDEQADDAFASVAAALLKAGIRSVVAMGYNLYVSGAQQFVPAFYQRLLSSGNVAEAARAGRQAMLAHPERVCVLGEYNLQDWLVPVLYQQLPQGEAVLPNIQRSAPAFVFPGLSEIESPLPEAAQYLGDYGFIGRERAVQALERARLQQPQAAFLIHGMAGIGKTTLAKGFLHWLYDTSGLAQDLPNGGVFWFSFDEIRSAEYIVNAMVDPLFGTNARVAPLQQKLEVLTKSLREHPFLLVWDNFESASGIAGTEVTALLPEDDRQLLKDLLKRLRGGKTKVLITSRSPENWLTPQECYRLPLSGLQGEELWEYCNAVVRDLGLKIDRKNQDFISLINELDGHPLAIRAILLRLGERKAADLLSELKQQFAGQEGDDSTRRIFAALSIFDQGLPEAFAPILQLVGLHQQFLESGYIERILKGSEDTAALPQLADCFTTLEAAGLLHHLGQNIHRMHPALHHHLSRKHPPSVARQRSFVDFMSSLANYLMPQELYEQRVPFALHGGNFHHALTLAQALGMDVNVADLTQSLARYAQNTCDYVYADRLFKNLANHRRQREDAEAVAYHERGIIAQRQRDYAAAKRWYKQSLAINEKYGNEHNMANNYHNLGSVAQEQRDYVAAERWYKQSLAIKEKHGNEHGAASTYHQLGVLAQEQGNYAVAERGYKQSLAIKEKHGNEHGAAITYHCLGTIAQAQRDYAAAEHWYKQSLAIKEKRGNEHGAANTYHQLGIMAQEQSDYAAAECWYKQSLAIKEKRGNEYDAASTYAQLGLLAGQISRHAEAGQWLLKAVQNFASRGDQHNTGRTMKVFLSNLQAADPATQALLRQGWTEAGLDQTITLDQLEQQLQ